HDATLECRGGAAGAAPGRDHGARRGQSADSSQASRLPRAQDPGGVQVADSSIPRPTFEYLASLEWVRAKENLLLIGPAGTGKSHALVGCGVRAVECGMKVRYLVAADLIETLYRGLADNTVGKVISQLLRNELLLIDELGFAPLDDTGSQLLFRFVAAAYE